MGEAANPLGGLTKDVAKFQSNLGLNTRLTQRQAAKDLLEQMKKGAAGTATTNKATTNNATATNYGTTITKLPVLLDNSFSVASDLQQATTSQPMAFTYGKTFGQTGGWQNPITGSIVGTQASPLLGTQMLNLIAKTNPNWFVKGG